MAFPLPDPDWEPTREHFAAAARGELAIPRCRDCGGYSWFPPERCIHCGGGALEWSPVSGRGTLFTWAVVRRAFLPAFRDRVPFVTALVALEEDPRVRLVCCLVDCDPEDLRVELPVRAVFRPLELAGVEGQVTVPMFAPAV